MAGAVRDTFIAWRVQGEPFALTIKRFFISEDSVEFVWNLGDI